MTKLEYHKAQLDRLWNRENVQTSYMVDTQYLAIHYARNKRKPLSWAAIYEWWADNTFNNLSLGGLKSQYYKEKARRGDV